MNVSEFKAKAISALKEVRDSGIPIQVTLRGKPLAQVIAPSAPPLPEVRFGTGKELIIKRPKDSSLVTEGFTADWEMEG